MDNNPFFTRFLKLDSSEMDNEITNQKTSLESYLNSPANEKKYDNNTNELFSATELETFFEEILSTLKRKITPQKYNTFFANKLLVKSLSEDKIEFLVTTSFIKKMIETHYMQHLNESIESALGKNLPIVIAVSETSSEIDSNSEEESSYKIERAESVKNTRFMISDMNELKPSTDDLIDSINSKVLDHVAPETEIYGNEIDVKKTFNNFIVGPSNNMAHASCLAVSENPGKVYPSLYLYSSSGLGKTHLLHAVANNIRLLDPSLCICLLTARNFMNEVVNAIRNNKRDELRRKYSEVIDVLMIDDIHELKNKTSTQEEFFHVFNELRNKGKQLIFTSDKLPKEIDGIEERIKTRLSWGLVIDIQQPDVETRIAILKRKALEEDIFLPDDVVNLIAGSIKSNIRELEGSLIRLGAYSSVFKVDIDLEIAKEQLRLTDMYEPKNLTLDSICKSVSSYFKIPVADLRSKARQKELTLARHIAMYFSHQILKSTLNEIGKYYGNRDHTSVLHAVQKVKGLLKTDAQISQYIIDLERDI